MLPRAYHEHAANVARWFPEVLLALGAPDLEHVYTPCSTQVVDEANGRTLEVVLNGRPAPPAPPPLAAGAQLQAQTAERVRSAEVLGNLGRLTADFEFLALGPTRGRPQAAGTPAGSCPSCFYIGDNDSTPGASQPGEISRTVTPGAPPGGQVVQRLDAATDEIMGLAKLLEQVRQQREQKQVAPPRQSALAVPAKAKATSRSATSPNTRPTFGGVDSSLSTSGGSCGNAPGQYESAGCSDDAKADTSVSPLSSAAPPHRFCFIPEERVEERGEEQHQAAHANAQSSATNSTGGKYDGKDKDRTPRSGRRQFRQGHSERSMGRSRALPAKAAAFGEDRSLQIAITKQEKLQEPSSPKLVKRPKVWGRNAKYQRPNDRPITTRLDSAGSNYSTSMSVGVDSAGSVKELFEQNITRALWQRESHRSAASFDSLTAGSSDDVAAGSCDRAGSPPSAHRPCGGPPAGCRKGRPN